MMLVLALMRAWWIEVAAFCAPPLALVIALCAPAVQAAGASGASIANVAAVQGAVTGLSLIALVLAVEMARRQEDRDDAVYDIMLRSAGIRPTFIFALVALLTTLAGMGLFDFLRTQEESSLYPKILLSAYVLTSTTGLALLLAMLRTIGALKPTAIIDYRFRANDRERQRKVAEFISYALNEVPRLDPFQLLVLPHRPVGLTASERVFAEIDDALQAHQATRFAGALERLCVLAGRSADQIQQSSLPVPITGEPQYGYWFPLDAIRERLPDLWRAVYERSGAEYAREMWRFQYWLVMTGIERRSGQMLEVGLRSGLVSYRAAGDRRTLQGEHAQREWMNLNTAAWGRLRPDHLSDDDKEKIHIAERLIEHLQEYGNMLLMEDDVSSFGAMLVEFDDTSRRLGEVWAYRRHHAPLDVETPTWLDVHHYLVLALLALGGRAILLMEAEQIEDAKPYLESLERFVKEHARPERFTAAVFERERDVQGQWSWWEMPSETDPEQLALFIMPERYPIVGLLYWLQTDPSSEPLPSFHGYAQRFIDAWTSHSDAILGAAEIAVDERVEASHQLIARLRTSIDAEQRERDDRAIAADIDQMRVTAFLDDLRETRRQDRLIEHYFGRAGRVRWFHEEKWPDGRLERGGLLPRDVFTVGTGIEPLQLKDVALAFERGLFAVLAALLKDARELAAISEASADELLRAIDNGLTELAADHPLIVLHGKWPSEVISELWIRSDRRGGPLSFGGSAFRQERVSYRGHWIAQSWTDGDPVLLMVDLDRWGWLLRAPIDGEDFALDLEEIDRQEAEQWADQAAEDERDREQRVRELMLKVRLTAQERARFEVENPDAALRIPVRLDEDA